MPSCYPLAAEDVGVGWRANQLRLLDLGLLACKSAAAPAFCCCRPGSPGDRLLLLLLLLPTVCLLLPRQLLLLCLGILLLPLPRCLPLMLCLLARGDLTLGEGTLCSLLRLGHAHLDSAPRLLHLCEEACIVPGGGDIEMDRLGDTELGSVGIGCGLLRRGLGFVEGNVARDDDAFADGIPETVRPF